MYQRSGMGTVAGSAADCAWCNEFNYFTYRNLLPSCQQYAGANCATDYPSIPAAFVKGAVPVMPPDQATIDSQTPDETINQMLAAAQANAVAAATAAAGQEAAGLPPAPPLGIPTWVWIAGAALLVLVVVKR